MTPTDYKAEAEHLRSEVARYREAALIAYGALAALNKEYPNLELFSTLNDYLFPTLSKPDSETPQ
jgi:hypothetical protein